MKYYINGWETRANSFKSIGQFTEEEWQLLLDGYTIMKDDPAHITQKEFYIVKED